MQIHITRQLEEVIYKLALCQDPSGLRTFFGTIKASVLLEGKDEYVLLDAEDPQWETEKGLTISTSMIRLPDVLLAQLGGTTDDAQRFLVRDSVGDDSVGADPIPDLREGDVLL